MLIHPLTQRTDLRQQPEHKLNRRLPTSPSDPFRIRNTHERKIPCATKESSRSPRPHVNAYDQGANPMTDKNVDKGQGRVKEAVGSLTGDRSLKNEGRADQAKAKVKDTVDKVADTLTGNNKR